jgi:hypothetical protein
VCETGRPGAYCVADDRPEVRAERPQLGEQGDHADGRAALARNPGGRHEHEASHTAGLQRCELGRDEAAERVACEMHGSEAGCVEQPPEPCRQVASEERAEARELDEVDAASFGERLDERQPPSP